MRVAILKSTGRVLEMQTLATAGTCLANAISAGHAPDEVEERVVSPEEYAALMEAQPKSRGEVGAEARQVLSIIDLRSIRAIRESIINGSVTPELLALEAEAESERAKL